jgi:hypothetical protein
MSAVRGPEVGFVGYICIEEASLLVGIGVDFVVAGVRGLFVVVVVAPFGLYKCEHVSAF